MFNRRDMNNLVAYNPFHEMENFEKHFFDDPFDFFGSRTMPDFRTDITDEGDHYELTADLPGFQKNDIHLDVDGDILTLSAERHSELEDHEKKGKYIRCERSYGSYSRTFDLTGIRSEDIKAKYQDGVLSLTLPKKEQTVTTARRLEIE